MAGDQPRDVATNEQRIREVTDEPLTAAPLLGPENVADKRDSNGRRI
jgi:hypothetical protein